MCFGYLLIFPITTGPDNNNLLALAFGVLIVTRVAAGSLLDHGRLEREDDAARRDDEGKYTTLTLSVTGCSFGEGNAQKRSDSLNQGNASTPKWSACINMRRIGRFALNHYFGS
jgi:hypothetical protein